MGRVGLGTFYTIRISCGWVYIGSLSEHIRGYRTFPESCVEFWFCISKVKTNTLADCDRKCQKMHSLRIPPFLLLFIFFYFLNNCFYFTYLSHFSSLPCSCSPPPPHPSHSLLREHKAFHGESTKSRISG